MKTEDISKMANPAMTAQLEVREISKEADIFHGVDTATGNSSLFLGKEMLEGPVKQNRRRRPETRFSWSDVDFTYLRGQPKIVQHLATLYEYARESEVIIRAVRCESEEWENDRECMELDQVPPRHRRDGVRRRLFLLYPEWELWFLIEMPGFPKRSFREVLDFAVERRGAINTSGPNLMEYFLKLGEPLNLSVKPFDNLADLRSHSPSHGWSGTRYLLENIPWEKSNFEIATEFRNALPEIRPDYIPDTPRPGRRGRAATATGKDLRSQLSAFRVQRSGGSRTDEFGHTSQAAWNKAVRAAAGRIETMPTSYLFAPSQSGQ